MSYPKSKTEVYSLMGGINIKASPYDNETTEFRDMSNMNFVTPGALTKRPGTSLYLGVTISGQITGGVEFERLNGASYIVVTANTNAYNVTSSFSAFKTGLLNGALFDFTTFVDRLFACNGQDFFKWDGTNVSNYSLPYGSSGFGVTAIIGGGLSGTYLAGYGYLNDRGYFGPSSVGLSIFINGITFGSIQYYGLTTPTGFGITALAFYRTNPSAVDLTGTTFSVTGSSLFLDTGFTLTTRLANDYLYFTLAPRYMEIYNNQLFMAGFSSMLSSVVWSDIGEPEGVSPDFNAEFRTNDGDRITGLKSYNGSLIASKERSFHRITGEDPANFSLQEISDQYGCVSNRAMVTFEDKLWFLDPKGIVEYNGANIGVVSNKVEPYFTGMNLVAARDNACAIHYRQYNEVWFAIPANGATFNNTVIVYDYLAEAWTKYDGVNPAVLFLAKGSQPLKTPFFGGYTGNLLYFGSSLMNDNGNAITCMIDTKFHADRGQSTENMYRRFYLNVSPVTSVTQSINIGIRSNYDASSYSATRTMYQNPFQSRIDFGVSARSIAAQVVQSSATLSIQITGYTFESRFQRAV